MATQSESPVSDPPFNKYEKLGAYHWERVSRDPAKRSAFAVARFNSAIAFLISHAKKRLHDVLILDVGCGDGVLSAMLAERGAKVIGIDNSELAVSFAKDKTKHLDISFQVESAYELPFRDSTFDIVVSTETIEHLNDTTTFLSEIKRVLKTGGCALVSTPIRDESRPLDPLHCHEWTEQEFKELMQRAIGPTNIRKTHSSLLCKLGSRKNWRKLFCYLSLIGLNPYERCNWIGRTHRTQYACATKESS